ncbi:MAG: Gfo/Idh/MocA family oxidoreductase [Planctomycetales bacterium]|nr:Gfo/Idh/MocA family oxidoreductase [Planctomycetales bacterium]
MQRVAHAAPGKIRIGQIGVGHAHASKLSVYRSSADYEVVGIVEPDEALRQQAAEQPAFRGLPWMSQDQLLNYPDLQAVLVETRVRDLLNAAEACITAGMHVHLDKPAGQSLSQYRRLLATAAEKQLLVQMGYMYRYNPAVLLLRQFLQQGWLGEVFEVHTVMSKVVPPSARRELAEYQGGMMFELGCHIIDLVLGVLGKPTRVVPYPRHSAIIEDRLLDNMLAVFEYPQATATVKSTALEVEGFSRRHLAVCGTNGTFHIQPLDNPSARVALAEPPEGYVRGYQELSFPKFTRYVADAADMARIIRGEKSADFGYEHDLDVQTALLEACGMRL